MRLHLLTSSRGSRSRPDGRSLRELKTHAALALRLGTDLNGLARRLAADRTDSATLAATLDAEDADRAIASTLGVTVSELRSLMKNPRAALGLAAQRVKQAEENANARVAEAERAAVAASGGGTRLQRLLKEAEPHIPEGSFVDISLVMQLSYLAAKGKGDARGWRWRGGEYHTKEEGGQWLRFFQVIMRMPGGRAILNVLHGSGAIGTGLGGVDGLYAQRLNLAAIPSTGTLDRYYNAHDVPRFRPSSELGAHLGTPPWTSSQAPRSCSPST